MAISHLLVVPLGTDCNFLKNKNGFQIKEKHQKFFTFDFLKVEVEAFFLLKKCL